MSLLFCLLNSVSAQEKMQGQWKNNHRLSELSRAPIALIPYPQKIVWTNQNWKPSKKIRIVVNHGDQISFKNAIRSLTRLFGTIGIEVDKEMTSLSNKDQQVSIRLDSNLVKKSEGYQLLVSEKGISILARDAAGAFYAVQTLGQLLNKNGNYIFMGCKINDWPSFSWRGYMIDAARNFMPMPLLKQQINVMTRYKLNIFHLHLTEDIAWRLGIKLYPQLTSSETMLRDKGQFYTEQDLKDLIRYCKERYITLVPELDIPGHSAAFKRAMKTDMQSDSGLSIVKNIIKEFCNTYNVPYLHIGADEVKITNKDFLPQVIALTEDLGKKVIGWEPGGNFTETTIRQLWMEGATKVSANRNIKYVDSRHLYINHMDPLESVVTIFNRKICNLDEGNESALGGTICTWPDRRVNMPEDVFLQNPVYPAMLAFAERSWRGGGALGWRANIGAPEAKETKIFAEFENRLMEHKSRYFSQLPFLYARQSATCWNFYGPYKNNGDLSKVFRPENKDFDLENEPVTFKAIGGTLILRHWWTPLVKGLLERPEENTTWYAITKIWSNKDEARDFWIGFNNLSRSYASDSPKADTWDNRMSSVMVNGKTIAPPVWEQAGQKGDMELPLKDEGYEFRKPARILLKKGWNGVLIKLPIASFKGVDWKNPEKWMFTFVSIE